MDYLKYDINGIVITNFYDEENDRVLKIHNISDEPKKVIIYYYYPSIFYPYYRFEYILEPSYWVIPEKTNIINCSHITVTVEGHVDKHFISLLSNKNLKNIRDKIICVGLNKTSTTSLTCDLNKLGLKTWGESSQSIKFSHVFFNNKSIGAAVDLIEKSDFDFFQDIPFSCPGISERIINLYPQCRYILTKRTNTEQWVKSVKNFWPEYFNNGQFKPNALLGIEFFLTKEKLINQTYPLNIFDTWNIDDYEGTLDEKLSQVYENHNISVKNTLINNNCDWIEIDVSKKGELKRLTDWLGIDNDKEDFVWTNKSKI